VMNVAICTHFMFHLIAAGGAILRVNSMSPICEGGRTPGVCISLEGVTPLARQRIRAEAWERLEEQIPTGVRHHSPD
jgi:hypothetical protein